MPQPVTDCCKTACPKVSVFTKQIFEVGSQIERKQSMSSTVVGSRDAVSFVRVVLVSFSEKRQVASHEIFVVKVRLQRFWKDLFPVLHQRKADDVAVLEIEVFFWKEPLYASSTIPTISLLGSWPRHTFSFVQLKLPLGSVNDFTSTRRRGTLH